jgi:DNA-binding LacI/PurR family transcriptional regulator
MVAQLLLARGHKRIAFLAGLEKSSTNLERERGFQETLAAAGVALFRREIGHYNFERAREATRAMFADRPLRQCPDAVFVANDHMAIAAMDVLRQELGLRVPEDVSVVGFDDQPFARMWSPPLTTVAQDFVDLGRRTFGMLARWVETGERPEDSAARPELVLRESAAPPRD